MRIRTIALLALCALATAAMGQVNQGYVTVNAIEIRRLALAAIIEKHPDLDRRRLEYRSTSITLDTNDNVTVAVSYLDRGTEEISRIETNRLIISNTRVDTFNVYMDGRGKIEKVTGGYSRETKRDTMK